MIMELVEKSQLHDAEKNEFLEKLKSKEAELEEAQKEVSRMRRRMMVERMKSRRVVESDEPSEGFIEFTKMRVIGLSEPERYKRPSRYVQKEFNRIKGELPEGYLEDLEQYGLVDSERDLTQEGVRFLRRLAEEME